MKTWISCALLLCGMGSVSMSSAQDCAPPCNSKNEATSAASTSSMRELSSVEFSRLMGVGWNLGNSLEAIGGETAWGNAATTQKLIDAVKAAGFKSIRIPLAWKQYADDKDHISPVWMARVNEVVDYAQKAGLITIINVHWDGGWMQPTYAAQPGVNARLTRYWTQIAQHFKNYGDTLLFAGSNEVMFEGDYGPPKREYYTVQNSFNQTFVDAVRATGGNNLQRHLIVQGFNTNIDHTLSFASLPKDPSANRLMMEVHYYDPSNYTINAESAIWQWGASATQASATESWANEAYLDAQFQKMKSRYVERGVAVIVGEYGVISRPQIAGSQAYRIRWNEAVTRSALKHGLVPVYWDNGVTGKSGMGLFDRRSGAQAEPELIRAIVNAAQ
jgi:endoglucanase